MSSEAFSDAMTETMTPQAAARVLTDAAGYEASLQQRTEGITAMIWSAVGPGIYLTYAYAGIRPSFPDWGYALLWIPWILAGTLITFTLWRSAALAMPHVREPRSAWGYLWRLLAITLAMSVVFAFWDPDHYGAPLLVIGVMYLVMAIWNPYRMSRRGRGVASVAGISFLLIAALAMMLPETGVGFTLVVLLSGLIPLLSGFWQAMAS